MNSWSKTETQRWLDDRAEAVKTHFAGVLNRPLPGSVRFPGQWIYNLLPRHFEFIHDMLRLMSPDERDTQTATALPRPGIQTLVGEVPARRGGGNKGKMGPNGARKRMVRK